MKSLKIRALQQAAVGVLVGGVMAAFPFAHVGASSLSTTTLVTKGQNGGGANSEIHNLHARSLSANGRELVFSSRATNLGNGSNGTEQIYAYDRITKQVQLVSRNATGGPASGPSFAPTISADGRYVAYSSTAHDLASDVNWRDFCSGWPDPCINIYVHDLVTKYTRVVNVDSEENRLPAAQTSDAPTITRDGRFVTFASHYPFNPNYKQGYRLVIRNIEEGSTRVIELNDASGQTHETGLWNATINDTGRFIAFSTPAKLVANDNNNQSDIYLYDVWDKRVTFVSKGLSGFGGDNLSFQPVISTDGNFIVYESSAGNLTPKDHNQRFDVFLYDRAKGTTRLISKSTKGVPGQDNSFSADISGDGQYVVFASHATNLIQDDTAPTDIFLHYTNYGTTRLISRASHYGAPGDANSYTPSISQDGKAVAFLSRATNLAVDPLPPDTYYPNLFIAFDPFRHIPYYDQADLLEMLRS